MTQFSPRVQSPTNTAAPRSRLLQRACACASKQSGECESCKTKNLQRRGSAGGLPSGLPSPTGFDTGGRPLARRLRERLEPSFGVSFANVRVHDDSASHQAARGLQAHAFTLGQHVHFASGQFRPHEPAGLRLLAHELAHTVQQRGQPGSVATDAIGIDAPDSEMEQRADAAAAAVLTGRSVGTLSPTGRTLARSASGDVLGGVIGGLGGAILGAGIGALAGPVGALVGGVLGGIVGAVIGSQVGGGGGRVFSESAAARFTGYDASVTPNWLVVPTGGARTAAVAVPAGGGVSFVSADPTVATVTPAASSISVQGVAAGTTRIDAQAGGRTLEQLRIAVKNRRDISTGFNYVSDSAAPAPHATTGTTGDTPGLLAGVNLVWEQQANVRFTDGGSQNVTAPGDLGPTVDTTTACDQEWPTVTALGAGNTYNVFRVWDVRLNGASANGGINCGANTLLGDASCADGLGLAHESGHHLTLQHAPGGIMTPCGSRTDQRVPKSMADTVNP